jgi:Ankyrin repeats (3 copies)
MFPNPQDALPLPERPNLEHYRRLAKELVKVHKADAIGEWVKRWMDRSKDEIADFARRRLSARCTLADAQFVVARSHGFESWPKFSKHLEALARKSPVSRFEEAADAIVGGDIATLRRLLSEDSKLVRATSTREHGSTLLHYVSANGVESYRQKTPRNIVEIAEILLRAGAEIDATANVYGGGCTTLALAATSVHPERAGVQEALLQKLLDHGASLELVTLTSCLANGRPRAAGFLANRGARLDLGGAAGIGRLDIVKSLFDDATKVQRDEGFLYASAYGRNSVVEFLLGKNADLAAQRRDGQTALHLAVIGGHLETVALLLTHRAPLETRNVHGGTVLGQALWSAAHGGDPEVYIAILEALFVAGAKIPERHTPVNALVDAWMSAHGSRAEPSWHW